MKLHMKSTVPTALKVLLFSFSTELEVEISAKQEKICCTTKISINCT